MRKLIQKRLKNQKGLTLIELLVVIVILGIIAAIVIPMVVSNQDAADESTRERQEQLIQDAVNRYIITGDDVPDNLGNIGASHLIPDYLSSWPDAEKYDVNINEDGIVSVELN
ncbi:type II secretion system protein [Halalkalibacter alkaliphilus]|uniref:type II secretion system protein n=1 Tax=Halalkalibacter alkaliphilus TaxID=2917993 RepID=UPI003083FB50